MSCLRGDRSSRRVCSWRRGRGAQPRATGDNAVAGEPRSRRARSHILENIVACTRNVSGAAVDSRISTYQTLAGAAHDGEEGGAQPAAQPLAARRAEAVREQAIGVCSA
eukprot:2227938-Pleurochrysis_carterae.AAC.9